MRLYAITGRVLLPGGHEAGRLTAEETRGLVGLAREWAAGGVEWVQIREKDLGTGDLLALTREMAGVLRGSGSRLLVNGAVEVALAAGAHGVHLAGGWTAGSIAGARVAFREAGGAGMVSVACHSMGEAEAAREAGVEAVLFAPVFGKRVDGGGSLPGRGVEALGKICRAATPAGVFALGGVTVENAGGCVEAGAAGVAGIRLFQAAHWRQLRG
jgi:thiamine-phosphate pyrophosphorylase